MTDAVIVGAVRTPIGRHGGALARVRPDDLAAVAIRGLLERTRVDSAAVDDVILGCANQAGEDNRNVARMALLLADFPVDVPGQTVNRLCGSGLQALNAAAQGEQLSGLEPIARVVSTAVAGVRQDEMGLGPIPASRKALRRVGLDVGQ